jgi:hypothetical protein
MSYQWQLCMSFIVPRQAIQSSKAINGEHIVRTPLVYEVGGENVTSNRCIRTSNSTVDCHAPFFAFHASENDKNICK